jgi:hypothetical protein
VSEFAVLIFGGSTDPVAPRSTALNDVDALAERITIYANNFLNAMEVARKMGLGVIIG